MGVIKYIAAVALALVLVLIIYSVYKTKRYLLPRQITLAFVAVILIAYLLYTCQGDDWITIGYLFRKAIAIMSSPSFAANGGKKKDKKKAKTEQKQEKNCDQKNCTKDDKCCDYKTCTKDEKCQPVPACTSNQ